MHTSLAGSLSDGHRSVCSLAQSLCDGLGSTHSLERGAQREHVASEASSARSLQQRSAASDLDSETSWLTEQLEGCSATPSRQEARGPRTRARARHARGARTAHTCAARPSVPAAPLPEARGPPRSPQQRLWSGPRPPAPCGPDVHDDDEDDDADEDDDYYDDYCTDHTCTAQHTKHREQRESFRERREREPRPRRKVFMASTSRPAPARCCVAAAALLRPRERRSERARAAHMCACAAPCTEHQRAPARTAQQPT